MDDALKEALRRVRTRYLAETLGISVQAISQWRRVPPTRVLDVERVTGVSRHLLRPDIYPPEQQRAAS